MTRKINELTIPTDGLVLDLPLDGNANARVGSNGTATNVVWQPAERGYVSEVGSFNGSISYITKSNTSSTILDNDFSISIWFNINNNASSQGFLYNFGLRDMGIRWGNVVNNIQFQLFDGTTNAYLNTPVNKNEWVHGVFVRDKSVGMKIYINGVEQVSNTFTGNASTVSRVEQIGRVSTQQYYYGNIGLVKIYNKALSQDEIDALYSEGLRKLGPSSAQIWRSVNNDFPLYTPISLPTPVLDISKPQSGGLYYDQSGNGNDGVNTNVTDSAKGKYNVMNFNGSDSFINIPSAQLATLLNGRNPFSISIWVKLDTLTSGQIILDTRGSDFNGFFIELDSNSKLKAVRSDGAVADTIAICDNIATTGTFCNLVITYDGTNGKMYRDSVEQTGGTSTRTLNSNGDFKIGKGFAGNSSFGYLNGSLINTKIYNSELNKVQVEQDFYSSFIPN